MEKYPKIQKERFSSTKFMELILNTEIPKNEVAIWHLGQNSFILRSKNSPTIAIDPYLTDFCGSGRDGIKTDKSRFLPILIEPEDLNVDLILLTHNHKDHTDLFSIERLKSLEKINFICPYQVIGLLKSLGISDERINLIHPKEEINHSSIKITGTFALPTDSTDLNHVGYIIEFQNGKKYYNTGDTSFTPLLSYIEDYNIDLMSICINGGYNNLSHFEAAKVSKMINPQIVTPSHYDVMPHNWQPPEVFRGSLRTMGIEKKYKKLEYFEVFYF